MPETEREADVVGTLRSKVEESDIKQYLKSSLGGYTKSSVLAYLNILRKQQQQMTETFMHNQQGLFEEKESLRKANEALKAKLSKAENDYRDFNNTIKIQEIEDGSITPSDIAVLKTKISALEDELTKKENEKGLLEKQLEHRAADIIELEHKLELSEQKQLSLKELIKTGAQKKKELDTTILRLTGTIDERDSEISFLNSRISEGHIAELTVETAKLAEQLESQTETLGIVNNESILKEQTIETLMEENEALKKRTTEQANNIQILNNKSEKQQAACAALAEQLEAEYRRMLKLISERSDATLDRLEMARKLDEASSKLALLELRKNIQAAKGDSEAVFERN